jgi:hypothetical protein
MTVKAYIMTSSHDFLASHPGRSEYEWIPISVLI